MAIAYDAGSGVYKNTNNTSPASGSHTCTGSDLMLVIFVYAVRGDRVSGVTYNGVSCTFGDKKVQSNGNTHYVYYLANPATGTNTISVSFSAPTEGGFVAGSYTGVSSASDVVNIVDSNGSSVTTLSNTINMSSADSWMVGTCGFQRTPTITAGGSFRYNSPVDWDLFDSNGTVGSTGNYTMTWTFSSITVQGTVAMELQPAGAGGGYRFVPQLRPFAGL